MKKTIKDVAECAGVSIATVSHVINKTRYVKPELSERVNKAIDQVGYVMKTSINKWNMKVGRASEIALILDESSDLDYLGLSYKISELIEKSGYSLVTYFSDNDVIKEEQIISNLLSDKKIAGLIFFAPKEREKVYQRLGNSGIPYVLVGGEEAADDIVIQKAEGLYNALAHLIKHGHRRILLLVDEKAYDFDRMKEFYKKAFQDLGFSYDENLIIGVGKSPKYDILNYEDEDLRPTGVIALGEKLLVEVLGQIKKNNLSFPKDISLIGLCGDNLYTLISPKLSQLSIDTDNVAKKVCKALFQKIEGGGKEEAPYRIPVNFKVGKSTSTIERGPMGEIIHSVDRIRLTSREIESIKKKDYKVGISFHYGGTEWTRYYENAIRNALNKYGIKIAAVTEAHFDADLQIEQLEGLRMQKLDAIISLPIDEKKTASKYKELAKETNLIFLSNAPFGLEKQEYCAVVSVNEQANGENAGKILEERFKGNETVHVGMIKHGLQNFVNKQRDYAAEQYILENCPNLKIVAQDYFVDVEDAYNVGKKMMQEHPEIEALYVSWEHPALKVIKALKELGRTDVCISTLDFGYEICSYLARDEMVAGISAQNLYEQGKAVALVIANALLSKKTYKYIGVNPKLVFRNNLSSAWKEIMRSEEPGFLKE